MVNDVKTTNYTYITSSQIEVKDALQAEDVVSIRRTTPIKDKLVSFTDLNILNGETQNLAQEQVFNAVQEMYDDNTKFKIDTENNILQNRTEIDAQIEANNQELLNIQSSFESEVNTTIETVKEAAEKINNLEQAVTTATSAATTATNAANTLTQVRSITETATQVTGSNVVAANEAANRAQDFAMKSLGWDIKYEDEDSLDFSSNAASFETKLKALPGYSETGTQVLKSVNGALQWITE